MNTTAKTEINAATKFGDKYGKNLMDTAQRIRNRCCKNCF